MSKNAIDQARAQLEAIREMVKRMGDGGTEDGDAAREEIQQDPLEVVVRTGWYAPGEEVIPEEFQILLCTGGPAVRIAGTLNQFFEPQQAWIEFQDWFEPWAKMLLTAEEERDVLIYSQCFWYGG